MRISNRALVVFVLAAVGGIFILEAGFGPASWEGRARVLIDDTYRDTTAARLGNGQWRVTCLEDAAPCERRAEAVCPGGHRTVSEDITDHDMRPMRTYRGFGRIEGGPRFARVIECRS